ncbi:hypothetical protein ACLIBG_10785 [Virgibacillus sp. W0181]
MIIYHLFIRKNQDKYIEVNWAGLALVVTDRASREVLPAYIFCRLDLIIS